MENVVGFTNLQYILLPLKFTCRSLTSLFEQLHSFHVVLVFSFMILFNKECLWNCKKIPETNMLEKEQY